jgi:hypothetical protein
MCKVACDFYSPIGMVIVQFHDSELRIERCERNSCPTIALMTAVCSPHVTQQPQLSRLEVEDFRL